MALPAADRQLIGRRDVLPADPEFPQLAIAGDCRRMLDVFRANLRPVSHARCAIVACVPARFRCRQSTSRCVLQYTLRIADRRTGRQREQPVTGVVYARPGEAERVWRELRAGDPWRDIPVAWLGFEPVALIDDLQMVVQVFPYDRRIPSLRRAMGGALEGLDAPLLARLGAGRWRECGHTLEPARYRAELGAILKYTLHARDAGTGRTRRARCYVKVYRGDRGRDAFDRLRSLSAEAGARRDSYSVVRPIAYLAELGALALEEARGSTLLEALRRGRGAAAAARLVGRAVAAFNQDDVRVTRSQSRDDQIAALRRAAALVRWACPELGGEADAITGAVATGLPDVQPLPIHGDLKPDHVFVSQGRVTFIDLDSVVLGDPVRDPAHLVAYLLARSGLESMPLVRARAAAATFAEEYFRHVPQGWRERFPLHCAGALVEVAGSIFRRQRPHWQRRIAWVIAEARRVLDRGIR